MVSQDDKLKDMHKQQKKFLKQVERENKKADLKGKEGVGDLGEGKSESSESSDSDSDDNGNTSGQSDSII